MKKRFILITLIAVLATGRPAWGMEASPSPDVVEARQIRAKHYIEILKTGLAALTAKGDFQDLMSQIEEKKALVKEKEDELRRVEREQPAGARTWEDIRRSHERTDQDLSAARAELSSLQNNSLYQEYLYLNDNIQRTNTEIARLTAPSPSPLAPTPPSLPPSGEKFGPSSRPSSPPPSRPSTGRRRPRGAHPGPERPAWRPITFGIASVAATTAALYAMLKWYQRRAISRVVARHNLKITQLSPTQKNALAAALMARYRIPGSLRKLAVLTQRPDFSSEMVPATTMWQLVAEIYYKGTPTDERIAAIKAILS